ncbi:arf-GAP with SH3 domain, ANK repeat and PH domain-containing protein 3 isoform X2 [Astyanax mexicanus]|uniref:arf-GAP with SH3 domain, ANK repeat and PH domain-containing protein 3 isoform X2 n=1 Tax=Astyanax mexicanus TaxID=7994 RepID=UPI0020CB23C0|nr:arf-GAP with SH3 domain, ANK repeat and PH domain-containing protein 3 isoform X2 [Astyanax mexicanus]
MPESVSVCDFVCLASEDLQNPNTSGFHSRLGDCRSTVSALEESLETDLSCLQRMKKMVKSIHATGLSHVESKEQYTEVLENLGNSHLSQDNNEISTGFLNLAVFTREVTTLFKTLVQNLNSILSFPLESILKHELRDTRLDLRKQMERSWKDYDVKLLKVERERQKQAGLIRLDSSDMVEDMERERRTFQLQMCEYLLKVQEIKMRQGPDLLQSLIKYFQAQLNFFQDGLKAAENLSPFVEKLAASVHTVRQDQDEEAKQLSQLRDALRSQLQVDGKEEYMNRKNSGHGYSIHQPQGNKKYGTEKSGFLLKKSDGIRKVWQKRKCGVKYGCLTISHSTINRPPAKLNLLTCQVRPNPEEKRSFDLVTHNRTYHFQAEDEQECMIWVSVLQNSKDAALNTALSGDEQQWGSGLQDLSRSVIAGLRNLPGNEACCDCGAPDPSWLSTNLGILTCIECSGIHRELGVHYSRIQSLTLDMLSTSELLLAVSIGNNRFNDIMEANLRDDSIKPLPTSGMNARKDFITAKYVERRYVLPKEQSEPLRVYDAVKSRDLTALLQLHAEGEDLARPAAIPDQDLKETPLHLAVRLAEKSSLALVDFLIQNCGCLEQKKVDGNTALHYSTTYNKPECLKLLLKGKATLHTVNSAAETALDIAKRLQHSQCVELLELAHSGKFNSQIHVEYMWETPQDMYDSEDDLDERVSPPRNLRSPLPSAGSGGNCFWNSSNGVTNKTYQNVDFLYRSPPANSAPSGVSMPPPLPAKSIQRGRSDPQISFSAQESNSRHSSSSSGGSFKNSPPSPLLEASGALPRSPRATTLQKRQTVCWEGQSSPTNSSIGPVVSEKTTSYRRTNGGGSGHGRCGSGSPGSGSGGSVEELYCSLSSSTPNTTANTSTNLPVPLILPPPRSRKNAMCSARPRLKKVRALVDCMGVSSDQLAFCKDDVIIVTAADDLHWWFGHVEGKPSRAGSFPVNYVQKLGE